MGVSVVEAGDDGVRLRFPLEPNINHRQSAFGGSESSAAILAAWSLLWVRCGVFEERPRLVIASNSMEYLRPVTGEFFAAAVGIQPAAWQRFVGALDRRGIARIQVEAVVEEDGVVCGRFSGVFVGIVTIP
jgi:thioesterase domain-containing protein